MTPMADGERVDDCDGEDVESDDDDVQSPVYCYVTPGVYVTPESLQDSAASTCLAGCSSSTASCSGSPQSPVWTASPVTSPSAGPSTGVLGKSPRNADDDEDVESDGFGERPPKRQVATADSTTSLRSPAISRPILTAVVPSASIFEPIVKPLLHEQKD